MTPSATPENYTTLTDVTRLLPVRRVSALLRTLWWRWTEVPQTRAQLIVRTSVEVAFDGGVPPHGCAL